MLEPPRTLRFAFSGPTAEGPLVEDWELELHVDAAFSIESHGRVIYSEPLFPIVELARQAAAWARRMRAGEAGDFRYVTAEAHEENPWLWFTWTPHGWIIGAHYQDLPDPQPHAEEAVLLAVDEYVRRVQFEVHERLGVDVAPLLERDC